MKKRVLALALCAVLLLLLLPAMNGDAAERLTFIAINDSLPVELINCVLLSNGVIYVPYYLFSNYDFGISSNYFQNAGTVYLYAGEKQLFFDLNNEDAYDAEGNHYPFHAVTYRGSVYVPLNLVQFFFGGFSYSYITGSEYGNILRITTDDVILTDTEFSRALGNALRDYYYMYNSEVTVPTEAPAPTQTAPPQAPAGTPPAQTEAPQESVSPVPETPQPLLHVNEPLVLGMVGLPDTRTLTQLSQMELKTTFFLTAEEIRSAPQLVRRLAGEGNAVGVFCRSDTPETEWQETAPLLFEAARVRAVLLCGEEENEEACRAFASEEGLVFCGAHSAQTESAGTFAELYLPEGRDTSLPVLLPCGEEDSAALTAFLRYIRAQRYAVSGARETDYTGVSARSSIQEG